MTKKIFRLVFTVALTILIGSLIIILGVTNNYAQIVQQSQLQKSLSIACTGVEISGEKYLEEVEDNEMRFTWINQNGKVLFDTDHDASKMENHINREEIKEAQKKGYGESYRYSSTLTKKTMYYASKLTNGTILRVSVDKDTVLKILINMIKPIILLFIVGLLLSIFVAKKIAKKIVLPLNNINLDNPLENDTYDELAPLLSHIEHQGRQIKSQILEIKQKKKEFYSVIKNMNEGLILLNNEGIVLSINKAAESYLKTDSTCIGRDFLEIERNIDTTRALKKCINEGHSEIQIERNGKYFQINISRIDDANKSAGVVILIFEITDKVFAERNRKEFTANVSHELKTPLHSIMGSAELLENGLVKEEDKLNFVRRIKTEAGRLVTLIEDILKLSQLDENKEMLFKEVDLYQIAQSIVFALQDFAKQKNVKLNLEGGKTVIKGVPQLVQEIIYNLIQNAIKYNKSGGRVDVFIGTEDAPTIVVKDTGIGIPIEHQSRVFERFYRVDKSRSKDTGGTGLGLSIVKHSVLYMGGKIRLESSKTGTKMIVKFPQNIN